MTPPTPIRLTFTCALLLTAGCASQKDTPPDQQQPRPDYRSVEGEQQDEQQEQGGQQEQGEADTTADEDTSGDDTQNRRELMRMAAAYQPKVIRAILSNWSPPAFDAERLDRLGAKAVVYVRVDADGHVDSWQFRRRSGSEAFDDSIVAALETFQKDGTSDSTLPMPEDDTLHEAIVRQGFLLQNWDHRMAEGE